MDHFGIGAAIRGAANIYCHSARQTGRTTSLVESVKDGDRIVFSDGREAERVRRLCMDRGVKVDCLVINPRTPERVFESGTPEGRTIFDHSWVEQYYMQAIDRAAQDIDHLERQASGLQINLDYVRLRTTITTSANQTGAENECLSQASQSQLRSSFEKCSHY